MFDVSLDFGILGLDGLEVIELIQTQQAEFPQIVAEHVAFTEHELAANYFIAGSRVAAEIDSPDKKLFLLVERERQIDCFRIVVNVRVRHGGEVDETIVAVKFGVVLNRLADFCHAENFALLDREN